MFPISFFPSGVVNKIKPKMFLFTTNEYFIQATELCKRTWKQISFSVCKPK